MRLLGADGIVVSNHSGQKGVINLLELIEAAMRVAMALTAATCIDAITTDVLQNDDLQQDQQYAGTR